MNYEEAIIAFNKIIEIYPKNVKAYLALVDIYMSQGDIDLAKDIAEKRLAVVLSNTRLQTRHE